MTSTSQCSGMFDMMDFECEDMMLLKDLMHRLQIFVVLRPDSSLGLVFYS